MSEKEMHVIILLVEGDTEVEFYKIIRAILLQMYPNDDKYIFLQPKNVKGIGNYKSRASRQFAHLVQMEKKEIEQKKEKKKKQHDKNDCKIKYLYHAFMCIDTDVLDSSERLPKHSPKPPINEKDAYQSIIEKGGIPHFIKAVHSIEDWFLEDKDGIMRFLKIKKMPKFSNNLSGEEKLSIAFKKGNKVYVKGTSCKGFVDCLNIDMILSNHSDDFKELVELLR